MNKTRISFADIIPFAVFIVIFLFFEIASGGKMLSPFNLSTILEQSLITIVVGSGVLFVVAQGSIDLNVCCLL